MRALTLNSFDGPDAVTVGDVADPTPADGEAVVTVEAAGVGSWDAISTRGGFAALGGLTTFPQVLGWDFSGTVAEVGPGVTGWTAGDRVFGFSPQPWTGRGVYAEAVALPVELLARIPDGIDATAAAAMPGAILTAQLAVDTAELSAGQTVLVIGATGVVGGFVTQLARAAGAQVIASVSAGQAEEAQRLGASQRVDRAGDVAAQVRSAHPGGVDVLIDFVGPDAWSGALAALRDGGRFVTAVPPATPDERGIVASVLGVRPDPGQLTILARRVAAGEIEQRIAEVLPMNSGAEAVRRVEHGGASGKFVLDLTQ